MRQIKIVSSQLCSDLTGKAAAVPRLRANHNLHATLEDPVQRFLNAIEPESYVRPHIHDRWELLAVLTGAFTLLTFHDDGCVQQRIDVTQDAALAIEVPPNVLHSIVVTAPGTIILEVKPGPYTPATEEDFADWAPAEGSPGLTRFTSWLRQAMPGQRP